MRLALAAAALFALGSAAAHAADYTYDFKGSTKYGAYDAVANLTIDNGFATSGSGHITGGHLGDDVYFTLVTKDTPGAESNGGNFFQYRSNKGTDLISLDDAIPIDTHGILFALGPDAPSREGNLLFTFSLDGTQLVGQFFGKSADGTVFYDEEAPASLDVSEVSSAPEPGTWALMMLGVGAIGAMLGYRKRIVVDHKAKLAAIG